MRHDYEDLWANDALQMVVKLAKGFTDLGWASQEQLIDVLFNGEGWADQAPGARDLIASWLDALANEAEGFYFDGIVTLAREQLAAIEAADKETEDA